MPAYARSSERGAFDRYLRTGRRAAPLEVKYNHNHDPENGRFTSASGGDPASADGRNDVPEIVVTARRKPRPPHAVPQVGPFRSAATRNDDVGAMARNVNAFIHGQTNQVAVPLGGASGTVTVTRIAGSIVELDHPAFKVQGQLSVTPGREEIVIAPGRPAAKSTLYSVLSYPAHLRLFQAQSGKINYSIDRDLKLGIGPISKTFVRRGTYSRFGAK